jgi:hypothetical protein
MFRLREIFIRLALEHFKKKYTTCNYWTRDVISYTIYSQFLCFVSIKPKLETCSNIDKREKRKAIPLQAWTGPEDSRRLPDFKTIGT